MISRLHGLVADVAECVSAFLTGEQVLTAALAIYTTA